MKRFAVVFLCLAPAGCGTTPGANTDVPNAFYAGLARPTPQAPAGMTVAETGPTGPGTRHVSGISCRAKLWDPAPSEANAIALMQRQAVTLGFNAVHSVAVKPHPAPVALNCWQALRATGIAFRTAAPDAASAERSQIRSDHPA